MRRSLALLALVALAAGGGTAASAKPGHQLYGVVGENGDAQLTALNAETLAPYGKRVRLRTGGSWSFSPDKNHLAIGTGHLPAHAPAQPAALRVIDLRSMRRLMNVKLGPDPRLTGNFNPVGAVTWLGDTRIALLYGRGDGDVELVVVDTTARRIVKRTPLTGAVLDHVATTRELVLLVGERDKIAAPRLVAIDAAGAQRSVTLAAVRAGWTRTGEGADTVTRSVHPGLAADGRTAYVVTPDGVVARVDLEPLSVAYRSVTGRYAKLWEGASRRAVVVRPGLLAITGTDSTISMDSARGARTLSRPTGLELLDTTTSPWTRRRLAPEASWVTVWGGNLVATGSWWDTRREEQVGMGLGVYAADGTERFRVLDGRAVHVVGVFLGRAYVYVGGTGERALVDLETGEVRARRLGNYPWLLLDARNG